MITVKVQKWGNSLAVRIPKEIANQIGITQSSEMEIRMVRNREIVLKPKGVRKKYSLEKLLKQITPENRHKAIDLKPEGRELL